MYSAIYYSIIFIHTLLIYYMHFLLIVNWYSIADVIIHAYTRKDRRGIHACIGVYVYV